MGSVCAAAGALGLSAGALAAPVTTTIDFAASDPTVTGAAILVPPPVVTGSVTLTYDDAFAAPFGVDFAPTIDAVSLSFLGTTYLAADAVGRVDWDAAGDVGRFRIGGALNGLNTISGGTDDWMLDFTFPGWTFSAPILILTTTNDPQGAFIYNTIGAPIPAPASGVVALAVVGRLARRRR
ncbi:MAG: hypothetical protein D6693_05160 [Planctomycetota bacterium]|nr:MAG: hypothetical protein D6693_05160 [Planctomycetota bacterium]